MNEALQNVWAYNTMQSMFQIPRSQRRKYHIFEDCRHLRRSVETGRMKELKVLVGEEPAYYSSNLTHYPTKLFCQTCLKRWKKKRMLADSKGEQFMPGVIWRKGE